MTEKPIIAKLNPRKIEFVFIYAHCNVNSFVIRYEREEAFHSLQVTVKNLKLEDSLEQFVNGEILEGDNAYFCEKCNERVSVLYNLHKVDN